jgi:hypothetical protein
MQAKVYGVHFDGNLHRRKTMPDVFPPDQSPPLAVPGASLFLCVAGTTFA